MLVSPKFKSEALPYSNKLIVVFECLTISSFSLSLQLPPSTRFQSSPKILAFSLSRPRLFAALTSFSIIHDIVPFMMSI